MTEPTTASWVLVDGSNLAAQPVGGVTADSLGASGWAAAYGTPLNAWFQGASMSTPAPSSTSRSGIQVHTRVPKLLAQRSPQGELVTPTWPSTAPSSPVPSTQGAGPRPGDGDFEPLLALAHERGAPVSWWSAISAL